MSEVKLKKCPICGGEADLIERRYSYASAFGVRCKRMCIEQFAMKDKKTAIKDWNTRKPIDDIIEKLEHLVEVCNEQIIEYSKRGIEESVQDYSTELEAYKQAIKIIKGHAE